eukprot:3144499-Pleurochrysis_carterae.AAC.2
MSARSRRVGLEASDWLAATTPFPSPQDVASLSPLPSDAVASPTPQPVRICARPVSRRSQTVLSVAFIDGAHFVPLILQALLHVARPANLPAPDEALPTTRPRSPSPRQDAPGPLWRLRPPLPRHPSCPPLPRLRLPQPHHLLHPRQAPLHPLPSPQLGQPADGPSLACPCCRATFGPVTSRGVICIGSVVRLAQHVTQHIASADPPHAALLESLRTQGVQPQALLDCCIALCGCGVALPILPTQHRGHTTFGSHLFRHANQPYHTGPPSYTVCGRTHSISSYAGALLGTATPGSSLAVALLAPPHDLSSPAGVSAVCAPACAASSPSASSAGGREET